MKAGFLLAAAFNVAALVFLAYTTLTLGNGAAAQSGFVPAFYSPPQSPSTAPERGARRTTEAGSAERARDEETRRLRAEFDALLAPYRRDELDLQSLPGLSSPRSGANRP